MKYKHVWGGLICGVLLFFMVVYPRLSIPVPLLTFFLYGAIAVILLTSYTWRKFWIAVFCSFVGIVISAIIYEATGLRSINSAYLQHLHTSIPGFAHLLIARGFALAASYMIGIIIAGTRTTKHVRGVKTLWGASFMLQHGIIIFGAPGAGTSTIGRALAQKLGYKHFETDDFSTVADTPIPFTVSRPLKERVALLKTAITEHGSFVISGSMWDWGEPFLPLFKLAVFVTTPTDIRIARLEARELERYGSRISESGYMYENHRRFIEWAKTYDTTNPDRSRELHEQWITTLPCPVVRMDGTLPVEDIVAQVISNWG